MYGRVYSAKPAGMKADVISVETDISPGLPGMSLVGYLSSSVREAGERVRTALKNSGFMIPSRRVTVNLFPANIRKNGTVYDLSIAMSILLCMETFGSNTDMSDTLILGELSLDGGVQSVTGVLPVVHFASMNQIKYVIVPVDNLKEASYINDITIIGVGSIKDAVIAVQYIFTDRNNGGSNTKDIFIVKNDKIEKQDIHDSKREIIIKNDLKDIIGQETMKRGLIMAVSGRHHLLLTGEAGSGKSMTAKCIPYLMPDLLYQEKLELTKIYSIAGLLESGNELLTERPFRCPHSSITDTALIGGGRIPKPGEVSLADRGVLFLDEIPEFNKHVIDALRQPMEDRTVTVSRLDESYTFPADFMLVAARNNCPCGAYPNRNKCHCSISDIERYRGRVSHPIMDRIDISVTVKKVDARLLTIHKEGTGTVMARDMINNARERQMYRFKNESFKFNSDIPQSRIREFVNLSEADERKLENYMNEKGISARSYFKTLLLARTVADVNNHGDIIAEDVDEALFYKNDDLEEVYY